MGITLLEMVATVVLLAIIASTVSAYQSIVPSAATRAHTIARELQQHLLLAQRTALTRQAVTEVRLVNTESALAIANPLAPITPGTPVACPFHVGSDAQVQNWPGVVQFAPNGSANQNLDLVVGANGRNYRVQLFRASGLTQVSKL
jgi:type II secretory pathway pseudopilin PulG